MKSFYFVDLIFRVMTSTNHRSLRRYPYFIITITNFPSLLQRTQRYQQFAIQVMLFESSLFDF
jgi:branched-subunit amino acid transport protein AzlD